MTELLIPTLLAVLLWWGSTGLILYAVRMGDRLAQIALWGMGVAALAALGVLAVLAHKSTASAAMMAFSSALIVWGWNEMAFLMGRITGSRRTPCPPGLHGWARFRAATETVLTHEIALALSLAAIGAVSLGGSNQVGFWTFLILWLMRLSAKLNMYLGVPNTNADLLPERLAYLGTYFGPGSVNRLLPVSLLLAMGLTLVLGGKLLSSGHDSFHTVSYSLLATISALGALEHLMLILPFSASRPWRLFLQSRASVPIPAIGPERPAAKRNH